MFPKEMKSLNVEPYRLANTEEPTEDHNCPSLVLRAKHTARGILSRVNTVSVGASSESESAAEVSGGGNMDTDGIKPERGKNVEQPEEERHDSCSWCKRKTR